MPPASRNQRLSTAGETPAEIAGASLYSPPHSWCQIAMGRPTDWSGILLDRFELCLRRIAIATASFEVLRRPVESARYLSFRCTSRLADATIAPLVRSLGGSYDNTLAESSFGLHKTALVRHERPWEVMAGAELAPMSWLWWSNNKP